MIYRPIARNFAAASENKIHSDAIAQRYGFTGALVPGVTVMAYLMWPLTQRWRAEWLSGGFATSRLLKPAYEGETLSVVDRELNLNHVQVECRNASDTLLATLEYKLESIAPPIDERVYSAKSSTAVQRVEIAWDAFNIGEPFPTYVWQPDAQHNREYAMRVDDTDALFNEGVLHPHAILAQANQVLVRRFIMPAWIHTSTDIRFRKLLHAGDTIEVRAVPIDRFEKKGHHFIKVYIAFITDGDVATEIYHTAIFRVAG